MDIKENFKGHLSTINHHKMEVMRLCFKVGLYKQGLMHDLSKYSPKEFISGVVFYTGDKSPNTTERRVTGKSEAWLHHKGRNRHHFEYWTDYSLEQNAVPMAGVRMPRKYVAEMLMDRIAASKVYNGKAYTDQDPLKYYLRGKNHYMMHPQTAKELEGLLRILDKRGEKELFRFVKTRYLKKIH